MQSLSSVVRSNRWSSLAALCLFAAALSGCDFWEHKSRYTSYCDETGCYTCTPDGCYRNGGGAAPGDRCRSDGDCAEGCFCDDRTDTCIEAGFCDRDRDCSVGYTCDEARHSCVPTGGGNPDAGTKPTGNDGGAVNSDGGCSGPDGGVKPTGDGGVMACTVDCDCPADYACQAGACKKIIRPDWTCVLDVECSGGRCVNGQCQGACTKNADCGTGNVCQSGYCVADPSPAGCVYNADCPATNTCINGVCHAACAVDADCPNAADFCDKGLCRADGRKQPECTTNAQCPAGEECVNAICRTPCWANRDCGMCIDGPLCHQGYCSSQAEVTPQCKVKADCAAGKNCVNATCK